MTTATLPGIADAELLSWLRQQTWSDFAKSLVHAYEVQGRFTDAARDRAQAFRARQEARKATAAPAPAPEPEIALPDVTAVPIGVFTVEHDDGSWRTLRTNVQPPDASFAPGRTIIEYLSGSDNSSDYTGFGFVDGTPESPRLSVWRRFRENESLIADAERLLSDPDSVLVSRHCILCHRPLTRPSSVHAGVGPECAKKGWS